MIKGVTYAVLAATALILGGCNSNKANEEKALLTEENQNLRAQISDQSRALDGANEQLREKDLRIAELRRELNDAQASRSAGAADPFGNIPGVRGQVGAGQITAVVDNEVLFASGKAVLKNEAKRSLDKVADVLKQRYAGRTIRITGHTDTDPIKKSGFKTNYHLGFERAYAVREYLISRGVAASQISVGSWGPDQPLASKEKSRRVEIAVMLDE